MDETGNYYKDGPARVLEILRDTFGDQFKGYFEGSMDEIPLSYLPCIMVTTSEGTVENSATGTDLITETINIIIVINENDYLGAKGETDVADFHLRHLVLGQDVSGSQDMLHEYNDKSVMHALRTNFTLNNGAVNNSIAFNFYPAQRGEQIYTREAVLTLQLQRLALVPNRT
jgi:hypothetical protein